MCASCLTGFLVMFLSLHTVREKMVVDFHMTIEDLTK